MPDHDRLFKELLTTFFGEFVALFLPEVSAYLDGESVTFLDKEVFTDVTSREKHEVDIVARARFREEETFFLLHIENQSSARSDFNARMFRYFARLYEKHALPVYPIALFTYDTPLRAEPDTFQVAFPDFTPLDFRFRAIQLNTLSWRSYLDQPNPMASALMAKMLIAPAERPKVKAECLRLLATLKLNPAKMRLISGFVDTYLKLSREEEQQFRVEIASFATEEEREETMEIVTSWMEQGIEQGQTQMLLRQLTKRCGTLPEEIEVQVRGLPLNRIESLSEALLDFTGLPDLEVWLQQA